MASINIGGTIGDLFHRYTRDPLEINKTGKGNKESTNIVNLETISKQLYTKPEYIIKFLSSNLATSSSYNKDSKIWNIKGDYSIKDINKYLDIFMETFVLCPCGSPETILKAKKDIIRISCFACGNKTKIEIDNTCESLYKVIKKSPQETLKQYQK